MVKFIHSEKATKFCEISTLLLFYVVPVKSKVEISQMLWPSQNISEVRTILETKCFLTCSWRFLGSISLEKFKFNSNMDTKTYCFAMINHLVDIEVTITNVLLLI